MLAGGGSRRNAADDEFIDLIYASLLGETSWQHFLDRLAASLPGGKSILFFHDAARSNGGLGLFSGLEPDIVSEYNLHYASKNPWMPKAAVRKVGRGVTADEMLPHHDLERTEFYNDFLLRIGCTSAVGVTIMREEGVSFLLSTMTSQSDANENLPAAARLSRLAPHLARAFRHYRQHQSRKDIIDIGGSLFDAIDVGLIIAGEGSVVKSVSRHAETMLEKGDAVRVSPLGRLRFCCERAELVFRCMLRRDYAGDKVARFLVDRMRLTLIRIEKDSHSLYFEGPTVVVLMEPLGGTGRSVSIEDFARTHMLTGAERRALAGILSGKTVDEIAAAAGLSRETIRTQMKAVYTKTGVRTQIELVRLAAQIGPVADNKRQ